MSPTGEMHFHTPAAIAALLTILVRNAENLTEDFGSFEGQIAKTKALADEMSARAAADAPGAKQFAAIAAHVNTFYNLNPQSKALCNVAHAAIRALLEELPQLEWGPCNFVSHATLRKLIEMDQKV